MSVDLLEKPKVLVADDELSLREVLSIFLEQEGFKYTLLYMLKKLVSLYLR